MISNPILSALAFTLIHFVWQGVLIAGVLKLSLIMVSKHKPLIRYGLSCIAMTANLVIPILTFLWCFQLFSSDTNAINSVYAAIPINYFSEGISSSESVAWYTKSSHYLPYISMIWLVCVICLTLKLLLELYSVTRLPYQQSIPVSLELKNKFYALVKQLNLRQTPQLVVSLRAEVPMAIGWLKPVVLLPANMLAGLSTTQLEMLLLHELAHIRRNDYLVNFLQTVVEILLFFHPAVMWVSKQMRQEREYCSDDIAVAHCGNAIAYAHTLADTASLCKKHRHSTIPTMAMAASGGDLKQRVIRLVDHQCTNNNDAGRWFAGAILSLSIVLLMSKQFISVPQLNLTVSELSLFNFNNKSPKQESFHRSSSKPEHSLVETTIAKQLIAKQYTEQKIIVSPNTFSRTKSDVHAPKLVKLEPKDVFNQPKTTSNQSHVLNTATNNENISLTLASSDALMTQELSADPKEKQSFTSQMESEPIFTNSSSDINFNFEDKIVTEIKSTVENPYAGDIAELAIDLNTASNLTSIERQDLLIESYDAQPSETIDVPVKYPAELISASEPRYPLIAKRKGIELDIFVNFTIGKDGRIHNIEFPQQNKISYFKNAIIAAMNKWTFLPAQIDGQPVESKMSKIFSFNLS